MLLQKLLKVGERKSSSIPPHQLEAFEKVKRTINSSQNIYHWIAARRMMILFRKQFNISFFNTYYQTLEYNLNHKLKELSEVNQQQSLTI
jgi:hypothetical protein